MRACLGVTWLGGLLCHLVVMTPIYVAENETFLVNKYPLARKVDYHVLKS